MGLEAFLLRDTQTGGVQGMVQIIEGDDPEKTAGHVEDIRSSIEAEQRRMGLEVGVEVERQSLPYETWGKAVLAVS